MPRIGVRELKIHVSEIVQDVQTNRVRYTVTRRGEPIALVIPYSPDEESELIQEEKAWEEFLDLQDKISQTQKEPFDVADLMEELGR